MMQIHMNRVRHKRRKKRITPMAAPPMLCTKSSTSFTQLGLTSTGSNPEEHSYGHEAEEEPTPT